MVLHYEKAVSIKVPDDHKKAATPFIDPHLIPTVTAIAPDECNSTDSSIASTPSSSLDDSFTWDEPLQLYTSSLLRIVPSGPIRHTLDGWNRLDLKLLDEFGLPLQCERAKFIKMGLICKLLGPKVMDSHSKVQWRALHYDAWTDDATTTTIGFDGSSIGGLEFKIDSDLCLSYLWIIPTMDYNHIMQVLPLVIGPFPQSIRLHDSGWMSLGGDQDNYRAFKLNRMDWYFMIKEGWHLGTPGKVWDSVLVISDMFVQKILQQPYYLEHCHLLDLSAGTGVAGLLISSVYQHMFPLRYSNINITLTDLPEALPLIDYNKNLNGITGTTILPLQWGNKKDIQQIRKTTPPIDIIIASDVLYDPAHFSALIHTLVDLAVPERTVIYLGYKRRGLKESDEHYFINLCCEYFMMEIVDDYGDGDGNDNYMNNDDGNGDGNDNTLGPNGKIRWERRNESLIRNDLKTGGWLGSILDDKIDGLMNQQNTLKQKDVQIYRLIRKQQSIVTII